MLPTNDGAVVRPGSPEWGAPTYQAEGSTVSTSDAPNPNQSKSNAVLNPTTNWASQDYTNHPFFIEGQKTRTLDPTKPKDRELIEL